jgi:hypothetical protein
MIEVRYKCACMLAEAVIGVVQRDPQRDVIEWMETIVQPAISYHHRSHSPRCMRQAMEYLEIPMDPASEHVGAKTTRN